MCTTRAAAAIRLCFFINTNAACGRSLLVKMRIVNQQTKLPITNFDDYVGGGDVSCCKTKHGPLLPNNVRCLIVGPSGSGKTNVLFNLLFDPEGLVFENIYIFSKSLYQPKYQFLKKVLPKEIGYFAYDDNSLVIHPSDAKPDSIVIFDDIACEKHNNIRNYFTMGRHKGVDTFYLGQTYSRIPKQLIRDNANFIVLFKQDDMNLRHAYSDHVNTDTTFERFKALCAEVWNKDRHGFVVIDKERDLDKGRYRSGLDSFVQDL